MLAKEVIQQFNWIRKNDQEFHACLDLPLNISYELYEECLGLLLEESDRLLLKSMTKFLARKYFDIFLAYNPAIEEENLVLVVICCLRTAAKFSQNSNISQLYTLDYAVEQSGGAYTATQFLDCEMLLLRIMRFRLDLATPEDYCGTLDLMPEEVKKDELALLYSFILTLPEVRSASSEQIFFGCLLYWCRHKKTNPLSEKVAEALTIKQKQAKFWTEVLEDRLQQIFNN